MELTKEQFDARVEELLREESTKEPQWWWLSFADNRGWLGGICVFASGITSAVLRTHQLGINPGGECRATPLPPGTVPSEDWQERLLSRADLDADGGSIKWS